MTTYDSVKNALAGYSVVKKNYFSGATYIGIHGSYSKRSRRQTYRWSQLLNAGASYVTDRRSLTDHPQGSNVYQPGAGTKFIRKLLTGDNWLDPSTFWCNV